MKPTVMARGLALLVLPLIAACGGPEPEREEIPTGVPASTILTAVAAERSQATGDEAAYYEAVRALREQIREETGPEFEETMGPLFPDWAPAFIRKRVEINAYKGRANVLRGRMLSDIEGYDAIKPPETLVADHRIFVQRLRDIEALSREFEAALDAEDFVGLRMARAKYMQAQALSRLAMSQEYCMQVTPIGPGQAACQRVDPEQSGGDYGAELRAIFMSWLARFTSWVSVLSDPEGMTDEDLLDGFARFHPQLTSVHEETTAAVRALTPPPELEAGHEVVLRFFEGALEFAHAIDRAAADGDAAALKKELGGSETVFAALRRDVPDNMRPIVIEMAGPRCTPPGDPAAGAPPGTRAAPPPPAPPPGEPCEDESPADSGSR